MATTVSRIFLPRVSVLCSRSCASPSGGASDAGLGALESPSSGARPSPRCRPLRSLASRSRASSCLQSAPSPGLPEMRRLGGADLLKRARAVPWFRRRLLGSRYNGGPAFGPSSCSLARPRGGAPSSRRRSWNSRKVVPRFRAKKSVRSFLIISFPRV